MVTKKLSTKEYFVHLKINLNKLNQSINNFSQIIRNIWTHPNIPFLHPASFSNQAVRIFFIIKRQVIFLVSFIGLFQKRFETPHNFFLEKPTFIIQGSSFKVFVVIFFVLHWEQRPDLKPTTNETYSDLYVCLNIEGFIIVKNT